MEMTSTIWLSWKKYQTPDEIMLWSVSWFQKSISYRLDQEILTDLLYSKPTLNSLELVYNTLRNFDIMYEALE